MGCVFHRLTPTEQQSVGNDALAQAYNANEHPGRVLGYGWGMTKTDLERGVEASEFQQMKKEFAAFREKMRYERAHPSPMMPSARDSVQDSVPTPSAAEDHTQFYNPPQNSPKGSTKYFMCLGQPKRLVAKGMLLPSTDMVHNLPATLGYAKPLPQSNKGKGNVMEGIAKSGGRMPQSKKGKEKVMEGAANSDGRKEKERTMESSVRARSRTLIGYPTLSDVPHDLQLQHRVESLSRMQVFGQIAIPLYAYFLKISLVDYISRGNVAEVLADSWIGASTITLYLRYLGEVYLSKNPEMATRYSFILPHISFSYTNNHEKDLIIQHLMKHAGQDHLVFMAQNIGDHWVLVAMNMKSETLYFMDPLPGYSIGKRPQLKSFVETLMIHYRTRRVDTVYTAQSFNKLNWVNVKSPKQQDSVHCGHFVCCYVEDIIIAQHRDIPANFVHHPPLPYY